MSAPQLIYAPLAGRAELTRLIAAAGGLELPELCNMENFGKPDIKETGESKKDYMSPSGMPLLIDGDLKISQSAAIESYIARIAPKYANLTAQQRAIDNMYQAIKEELCANCAKAIFTTVKADPAQAKKDVTDLLDKWLAIFEEKLPAEGFINGQPFPTSADLSLVNIGGGFMPYGAAMKIAEYDTSKFKKFTAHCARTKAVEEVAKFLASDKSHMKDNPMGL